MASVDDSAGPRPAHEHDERDEEQKEKAEAAEDRDERHHRGLTLQHAGQREVGAIGRGDRIGAGRDEAGLQLASIVCVAGS